MLKPLVQDEISQATVTRLTCEYITQRILALSRTTFAEGASKDVLLQTKVEISTYVDDRSLLLCSFDQVLVDLSEHVSKVRNREQRKELFPLIQDVELLVGEFHKLLSSGMAQNLISNDKIASLNSLAYKSIMNVL